MYFASQPLRVGCTNAQHTVDPVLNQQLPIMAKLIRMLKILRCHNLTWD